MKRRALLGVAAANAAALAGCSALPMWDENGDRDGPQETEGRDAPEADPGGEAGDGPEDADYPEGYGPDGVGDPDAAIAGHLEALLDVETYAFDYEGMIVEGDAEQSIILTHRADNDAEVGYQIRDTGSGAEVQYFEDQRVYVRRQTDDGEEYDSGDYEYTMESFTGRDAVGPLLANVEYGDAEVVEEDGETYFRYVSEEVLNPAGVLRQGEVDEDRIDRFDVAIVVDGDGVVRHSGFVVEADRDITVETVVSGIDELSLDRPDWYDEAADA